MGPERGDYRKILWENYRRRQLANSQYSLRAFARDLGLSPSRLTEIFQRKNGMSVVSAVRVASRLALDANSTRLFRLSVEAQHSRSSRQREASREELARTLRGAELTRLRREEFRLVASWHHFAIVELLAMKDFTLSAQTAADTLDITVPEAKAAIDRLQRLGWIKRSGGRWTTENRHRVFHARTSSKAARIYHARLLEQAERSIERQSGDERDLHSLLLAFDPARITEAKVRLRQLCQEFNREFCATPGTAQEVYALTAQFFRLTKSGGTRK